MKTVAAVHTDFPMVEPTRQLFAELVPDCRLINIVDDSLIREVIRAGTVKPAIVRRLLHYYAGAIDAGAQAILTTCSSVGEVVEMARTIFEVPLLRIDEPMARRAVEIAQTVGVLATLPTTLGPTVRLVSREAARVGKSVTVIEGLAKGAYEALVAKDPATHDRLLLEAADALAVRSDVLVLAQGSMARMEDTLTKRTAKPVFSSPRRGIEALKDTLERMQG